MSTTIELLKSHNLKCTDARLAVLELISQSKGAVPYHELEEAVIETADRVTLYRILKTFEEKGLLHKTIDHKGTSKYALCHHTCNEEKHAHDHVHFNCTVCNETECLEQVAAPAVKLPRGYKIQEINLSINGVCKLCRA
jgi:Fur family ferric uptake transcriptional regulator